MGLCGEEIFVTNFSRFPEAAMTKSIRVGRKWGWRRGGWEVVLGY